MTNEQILDALNACFRAGVSFHQALEQIDGCETMAILSRYWKLLEMERALASASQYFSDRAAVVALDCAAVAAEIEAAS
jgi:hypothetical protein